MHRFVEVFLADRRLFSCELELLPLAGDLQGCDRRLWAGCVWPWGRQPGNQCLVLGLRLGQVQRSLFQEQSLATTLQCGLRITGGDGRVLLAL